MALNFDTIFGIWEEVVTETGPELRRIITNIDKDGYQAGVNGVKIILKGPRPDDGKTFG